MLGFQIIFAFLIVSGSYAFYEGNSDVETLTPVTFNQVTNPNDVWLVKFYASWCPASLAAVSEFSRAAAALQGTAKIGAIDASLYPNFNQIYGVTHVPTFFVFAGSQPIRYQGAFNAEGFIDAVLRAISGRAHDNHNSKVLVKNINIVDNAETQACSL